MTAITDTIGRTESYSYDKHNDVTEITDPLGSVTAMNMTRRAI